MLPAGVLAVRCFIVVLLFSSARAAEWKLDLAFGDRHVVLTPAEFAQLKPTEVETADNGQAHRFSGVAVRDLLALIDMPPGGKLRRPTLSLVVRVTGSDDSVTAFALAEFDESFSDRTILLATHQDGQPLATDLGPWRLIAPNDKRVARWVRQVVAIDVVSAEKLGLEIDAAERARITERAGEKKKFVPRQP